MITIEKYQSKLANDWDRFVAVSINGTIFQTRKFLSYHIKKSFNDFSLIIKNNLNIIAVIPAAIIIQGGRKILFSHPGASYGGIVLNKKLAFEKINEVIKQIDAFCMGEKIDSIILINSPNIYYTSFDFSLDYLLHWNNYHEKELYVSHAIQLNQRGQLKDLLSKRKLRYINNSKKLQNITFHNTDQINCFYKLLTKSKKRFGITPTHSLEELTVIQNTLPDKIKTIVSKHNGKIIGGMVLFFANQQVCLVFYNVTSEKYRTTQLAVLQLYYCIQLAKKEGYGFIDFGVSHTPEQTNPLAPKFSLIQFKEQFGARGVLRRVYQKNYASSQ